MARVKIEMPDKLGFHCTIPVRITDVNYGGHVGNDAILSMIHEARLQYLHSLGFTEMEFGGASMIMADVAIEFKSELFYQELLHINVGVGEITRSGFEIYYQCEKIAYEKTIIVAKAKTGMICFDYKLKKIVSVPEYALARIKPF
jgi:YbgC/YbaW family acyl-CoA thioester hydrolase